MTQFIAPESVFSRLEGSPFEFPDVTGSLVNGVRMEGEGERRDLVYPATAESYAEATSLSLKQVDHIVTIAADAFQVGAWRKIPLSERQAIFRRLADLIESCGDELAFLQTLETGIPYQQMRSMHVSRTANNFRFFADVATTLAGETYQQTERYLSLSLHEPIGVGLVIAPWNVPLALASMKIAACMITGNSCILKPSEYTSFSSLRLIELMIEAGVPASAVHLASGEGGTTGHALVSHPGVDAVSFVGGTATGQQIMKTAADGMKKVSLELGGKSANIVLADAPFEDAVDSALLSIYSGNGEQCLAGSRILVQNSIFQDFSDRFVARAENIVLGDPFDDRVELGPLAFRSHFDRVATYVQTAESEGAYLLCGGEKIPGTEGFFLTPVVVHAEDNGLSVCQDEIFGPFATLIPVNDLDDAIQVANESEFGLVSYIWTQDISSMMQAVQEIRAGTVWVNTPMTRDLRAPFGGYKMSGLGRDGIPGSVELFTEQKTAMIPVQELHLPKMGMGGKGA